MTDRPVLEAVGEVLAPQLRDALQECASWRAPYWWRRASMAKLAALGLVETYDLNTRASGAKIKPYRATPAGRALLSPTPIVNAPFERVPTHAGDPGFGPIPPETNVVHIDRDTPATPIVNAGEER